MQADEEIAGRGTISTPVTQRDQRIPGSGHADLDSAFDQLGPKQQGDLERDVLLGDATGKVEAGVSRVGASMSGIDRDEVTGPQSVGKSPWRGKRSWRASCDHRSGFDQARVVRLIPISLGKDTRENLGDKLDGEKKRIAGDRRGTGERLHPP